VCIRAIATCPKVVLAKFMVVGSSWRGVSEESQPGESARRVSQESQLGESTWSHLTALISEQQVYFMLKIPPDNNQDDHGYNHKYNIHKF